MNDRQGKESAAADSPIDAAQGVSRFAEYRETLRTVVYAVLIALVIRTLGFEPFNIPSQSMLPTLLVGDYLFVSKYAYGYSRHSIPFSPPLFDGRIWEDPVIRGDIAVFKLPRDNKTDYIKRIIGLPGDHLQMVDGTMHINGEAMVRERVDDFVQRDAGGNFSRTPQYRETLPNGVSYMTLDKVANGPADNTRVFQVPAGHYFAMGDNRDNSLDSRFAHGVGYVPAENLVGRAEILFFSTDGSARFWEFWRWPFAIRFGRLFQTLT